MVGETGGTNPSAVIVYSLSPSDRTAMTHTATIQSPNPATAEKFGTSIALGTDAVFIGTAINLGEFSSFVFY